MKLFSNILIVKLERIMRVLRMNTQPISAALAATLAIATPALSENPLHVEQLLKTGACAQCDLQGADLRDAHLIGADLRSADLTGANLTGANLEGADLTGANLEGADLTQALVTNAVLENANLRQTNLSYAKLYDVDVRGAILEDVNLTAAEIFNTGLAIGGDAIDLEEGTDPDSYLYE